MKLFKAPKESLGDLDAEAAATLIATASDVALVLDEKGVIHDLSFQRADLSLELEGAGRWLGQSWAETVTEDSQPKIKSLLREATAGSASRWRQVNYRASRGADVPILYATVEVQPGRRYVAIGRDLRAVAALQQRLVEAQISMERDYARLRHAETRYRMLFQTSSEPVLIVDAATLKVAEVNPAAARALEESAAKIVGRVFPDGLPVDNAAGLKAMAATARVGAQADEVRVRSARNNAEFMVSGTLFRQDTSSFVLVRFVPVTAARAAALLPDAKSQMLKFVDSAPDAFALTDRDGRILMANTAFLSMAQLSGMGEVRGEPIDRWLGRPGIDFNVLIANLRQHGSVRMFATQFRGEYGGAADVEISAVTVDDANQHNFGFAIRNVGSRITLDAPEKRELPRSVEQLTELVGRVPLKDLVRETTDVIERLCIEAALELTGDNRASAAEMLGLSRQSLYVKLRRYGIADLATEEEETEQ